MSDLRAISISDEVPLADIDWALSVSMMAAEAIHGAASLRLIAAPRVDRDLRVVEVDCSIAAGLAIALTLVALLTNLHGCAAVGTDRFGGKRW